MGTPLQCSLEGPTSRDVKGQSFSAQQHGNVLRAKDPKVQRAQVCIMVVGLVLQGITGSEHWPLDVLV